MADDDVLPPDPPRRSSTLSVVIAVAVFVAAGLFATGILPLPITFGPRGPTMVQKLEDLNRLRMMAGLLVSLEDDPLAPDGRIDLYEVLRSEISDREQILEMCRSSRTGKGPTWKEIEAGDYTNFPYQRRRGAVDRKSFVRVPVVWDREPSDRSIRDHAKQRLVAFSDGSVEFEEEAAFRKFLDGNPGQE